MSKFVNDKPFSFRSSNGTTFTFERSDFMGGCIVSDANPDMGRYSQDLAEMICYHVMNIHPNLNGFQGYCGTLYKF
jgi:hypothetical protein